MIWSRSGSALNSQPVTFFVRTASERDIPAIRALLVETWHDTYDPIYGAEKVTALTDEWHSISALTARLLHPNSEFLVADDGKQFGGMAYAEADETSKTIKLHQLYILPAMQGRGLGGMLLDEVIGSFPEANRMELEVDPSNAKGIAFYKVQGFDEVGRTSNCGRAGSGLPALIFARTLGA